jgi:lysozyme
MKLLYDLIRRFEGLRLRPYLCPAGVPTVGYGHTGPEVTLKSPPITPGIAERLMQSDADAFAAAAVKSSPVLLANPNRHAAIADFCFNLGTTRYKASTLRRKVNAQEWNDAADELRKWVWGGGRKLPGLVVRREAERLLMLAEVAA